MRTQMIIMRPELTAIASCAECGARMSWRYRPPAVTAGAGAVGIVTRGAGFEHAECRRKRNIRKALSIATATAIPGGLIALVVWRLFVGHWPWRLNNKAGGRK